MPEWRVNLSPKSENVIADILLVFWKGNYHNASVNAVQIGTGGSDLFFVLLIGEILVICAEKAPASGKEPGKRLLLLSGPDNHHFISAAFTHETIALL